MSDFFGGLTGGNIRYTDARINGDGPLPTSLSGPEGINGDPDGRYNFNDSLLSGIVPYAYGQGRMGADRNYQQIPNRKQFPVPPLWLPEPDWRAENLMQVSHSVDMGDIAFIVNAHHKQFLLTRGPFKHEGQNEDHTLPQWNVFCNICTVNYLFAGLHNYVIFRAWEGNSEPNMNHAWYRLFMCFKITDHLKDIVTLYKNEKIKNDEYAHEMLNLRCLLMLQQVLRLYVVPIGICSMSEKQGGQHEVGLKPVQAACNFFTTLTVDGQNRDLVNIWRAADLDAGDFLILRLEFCKETEEKHSYVLNHYYKDTVSRTMHLFPLHAQRKGRIQLIPDTFKQGKQNATIKHNAIVEFVTKDHLQSKMQNSAPSYIRLLDKVHAIVNDHRYHPYWHIGQLYNKKQSFTNMRVPTNDMEMTKGQLLQINFAPVWKGTMYKDSNFANEVKYCPATALQTLMFGEVEDMPDIYVEAIAGRSTETQMQVSAPMAATQQMFRGLSSTSFATPVVPVAAAAVTSVSEPIVAAAQAPVSSKAVDTSKVKTDKAVTNNISIVNEAAITADLPKKVSNKSKVEKTAVDDTWNFEAEMDSYLAEETTEEPTAKKKSKTKAVALSVVPE